VQVREGMLDQTTFDRWMQDGTFDKMDAEHTIYRGVLQIVASQLIGQSVQKSAGDSELHDGLHAYERARQERLGGRREPTQTKPRGNGRLRIRPTSIGPELPFQADAREPPSETPVFRARPRHRSPKFNDDDLKQCGKRRRRMRRE
jgi:hypothetical protein